MGKSKISLAILRCAVPLAVLVAISGCTSSTPKVGFKSGTPRPATLALATPGPIHNGETSGPERFAESAYGVSASPVVARGSRLPRGGGYEKVGSPYKVAGRTYYPTRTPDPVQTGRASWYGAAFHGRKTANGEVYDMNHLTAAHKTMPLPSYARVTNVKNGHSVIVRVNDRGPFSNNRVIDLSKRAAEILDYTQAGTAEVRVEYVGPAPLHGQDDDYLFASARGLDQRLPSRLPGVNPDVLLASGGSTAPVLGQQAPADPAVMPLPGVRPLIGVGSAYADERVKAAFAPLPFAVSGGWKHAAAQ